MCIVEKLLELEEAKVHQGLQCQKKEKKKKKKRCSGIRRQIMDIWRSTVAVIMWIRFKDLGTVWW